MKKLLLSLVACFAVLAANAWTVSYTNPSGWDEVYAYTYGGDGGEILGSWPGSPMTLEGDLWTISNDGAEPANIIFNNGNGGDENQTDNLVFENGATYDDPSKADAAGGGNGGEVTPGPGPETSVEAPAQLYLIGNPVAGGWGENNGEEMELVEDGVFAIFDVEVEAEQYFAFTAELGSWDAINANRVGPEPTGTPFVVDKPNYFVWGGDHSWQMLEAGTYDFYVNFNSMAVGTTLAAGVKSLTTNNGEEVIYNLQGVRVNRNNMPAGIYIINGKKVAVK